MVLASRIPAGISSAERLREYFALVRQLSVEKTPADLLRTYRSRAQFIVPFDRVISLSRRGLTGCKLRITRSSTWTEDINPWREPERLPIIESGLLCQLMQGARPVKMDQIEIDAADTAGPYVDGMGSLLASPLFHDGEATNMVVMMREAQAAFSLDELATLVLTSNLVGHTMSHLLTSERLREAYEALDREFSIVGEIQRDLLPRRLPSVRGISIAAHYETCTRAGGDYYDLFEFGDGLLGLLIADVSGHGPPAAVVMAMMHAILHTRLHAEMPPADALKLLNERLVASVKAGQFVTAFYGLLDVNARTLRYANAGHNPPRLLRKDNRIETLPLTDGLPLAVVDQHTSSENTVYFNSGDRLLMYTDGITETFGADGDMFGETRLDNALRNCRISPECVISCIRDDLAAYAGGGAPADDRTLVVVAFD